MTPSIIMILEVIKVNRWLHWNTPLVLILMKLIYCSGSHDGEMWSWYILMIVIWAALFWRQARCSDKCWLREGPHIVKRTRESVNSLSNWPLRCCLCVLGNNMQTFDTRPVTWKCKVNYHYQILLLNYHFSTTPLTTIWG